MRKRILSAILVSAMSVLCAGAQQPQTQTAPIYAVNAKYTNGVAPGYWPTPGAGLVLNLSAGTANCANTMVTYAGGTLTLTNNTTNYVYLNVSSSCVPAFNTSGFTSTTIPIATVVTASGAITTITDDRSPFYSPSAAGTGTVASVAETVPSWLTVSGSPITSSGTLAVTATGGQTSHQVIGTCNAATSFAPCALVASDIPTLNQNTSGTAANLSGTPALPNGTTVTTQAVDDNSTNAASTAYADRMRFRSFGTTFGDTAGSALTAGSVVYFTVPYACTITAWNISVDAGTVTFDIWKIASGTAIPTVSNTITASAKPALSTGTALHSTSMSGWTTSVTANDIFGIKLDTVATAKFAELDVQCNQ